MFGGQRACTPVPWTEWWVTGGSGDEPITWAVHSCTGPQMHSEDSDLTLQATQSQRMMRSDLSGSDEKEWGTEGQETRVWEPLGSDWGQAQALTWSVDTKPRQTAPAGTEASSSHDRAAHLLPASQSRQSCPPVFSGALCFLPAPSSPPPSISRAGSKTAFHSRITEEPQTQTLPGDLTSSNSPSFNSWIQQMFPETLPCTV